ncbi:glycosyltransferase [Roseobacter sp. HKCCD9010]|uniref:glycosyltransferase family 4 protein n=1 Tax=unclassified Roseobacter TaxID=196798 RepID=UPI0014921476|nr:MULTISPECIES: glycosyltransferase family 4 protein [unclassified Roseobacter]MBF9048774.1 glycosyltransferase [Rhodobacterales bacterium HKCCD4356]NNV10773.1 glycosyltransferase [Roseobacter sp. HKCCD7357]NNV14958.1 glycosyltransferase [Roseobacter sp. HKCCD8768]NNV24417.1 glycosyltransferase [Roseobacter sp. HKCCD8192]NNV28674.1 glycosyltransferase [Roseobacter sp. HKCCD9061]
MTSYLDPAQIDVIAPNFKRRLSGVTATVVRLVPLQAQEIAIAAVAPALPTHVPQIRRSDLLTMPAKGPSGHRVWHARRNSEMLAGLVLKHLLRKRLKLLFTSASQRHHTGYSKWLIRQMDAVISTSQKTADYLDRPSTVILHGINTESFSPPTDRAAVKASFGLPPGPLVGCFGRIRAQKGTDVFVDAMIEVLRDRPDAAAIVMGRATEKHLGFERDLKAKVAAAGLADRLLFPPEVPVHDIAKWYQALDLFIAPQRWEGFGLTPLEAMACAVPVVATTVGAFEELVVPGETGALIPPGDVPAMIEATAQLLDNPEDRARQAAAARAHVVQNFRIEGEAQKIIAIYRDLLGVTQ